jgi:CRP-like cAMP-binding protein
MANWTGNKLLDHLPEAESTELLVSSQTISLPLHEVVLQQDGPVPHAYFPTTSVLGIVLVAEGGKQVEGTTVGCEGMVGLPVFLGVNFHPFKAIVQMPGEAVRVPATSLLQAAKPGSQLDLILRRYTLFRIRCANQTGACNTLHAVEERMCRWLLMNHDRAGKDEFTLTHEFLSELLGVRRQTVSIIAGTLQQAGLIHYRRGVLRVLNRDGLEAASCECYETLKDLYRRIMRF